VKLNFLEVPSVTWSVSAFRLWESEVLNISAETVCAPIVEAKY